MKSSRTVDRSNHAVIASPIERERRCSKMKWAAEHENIQRQFRCAAAGAARAGEGAKKRSKEMSGKDFEARIIKKETEAEKELTDVITNYYLVTRKRRDHRFS